MHNGVHHERQEECVYLLLSITIQLVGYVNCRLPHSCDYLKSVLNIIIIIKATLRNCVTSSSWSIKLHVNCRTFSKYVSCALAKLLFIYLLTDKENKAKIHCENTKV